METETVITASSKTIKYELETKELIASSSKTLESCIDKSETETVTSETSELCSTTITSDVPPKPPPRNFPASPLSEILNQSIDTPKNTSENLMQQVKLAETAEQKSSSTWSDQNTQPPNSDNMLSHGNKKTSESVTQFQQNCKDTENLDKMLEPKVVSTPLAKQEKMDVSGVDTPVLKSVINIDTFKSTSEAKMSPTNSMVMAMIYSSKSKSGTKKKNSLMASK